MAHYSSSSLRPSSAVRWMACPGSTDMEAEVPGEVGASFYASEGSAAHTLGEMTLRHKNKDCHDFYKTKITQDGHVFDVSYEMATEVQKYVDHVMGFMEDGCKLWVEKKVDLSHLYSEGSGTADAIIYDPETQTLHVFDLKYGKGVKVDAPNNPQLNLYGSGAIAGLDGEMRQIFLHICQPRLDWFDTVVLSPADMVKFEDEVREAAKAALAPGGKLNPGEKQCQWCRAAAECPALYRYQEQLLLPLFDDLSEEAAERLTQEQMVEIYEGSKLVTLFLNRVEERLFENLMDGEKIEGVKLVHGRGSRKWAEDVADEVVDRLGDDAYKKTLVTVAQAEKILGKGAVDDLAISIDGKPKIVTEDAKGRTYEVDCADEFDELG